MARAKPSPFARTTREPTAAERLGLELARAGIHVPDVVIETWPRERLRAAWRWLADRRADRTAAGLASYLEGEDDE